MSLLGSPMASSVAVTRPEGCEPGDIIFVTTKSGLDIEVEVPEGVGPGEVFDVEFEASTALLQVSEGAQDSSPHQPEAFGSPAASGAGGSPAASAGTPGPRAAWDERFIEAHGWSPSPGLWSSPGAGPGGEARAGQPQLSPGTLAMAGPGISVWERMREDQIRRGETGFQRIAEQQLQAEEDGFGHPKISQGSEAILSARGESPSKRRERLARPIQRPPSADEQPTGFEGSRWHGGSAASCAPPRLPLSLRRLLL